jgi:hypothetical protein
MAGIRTMNLIQTTVSRMRRIALAVLQALTKNLFRRFKKMKCVFCEKEFEKLSCEHIIPNVLCGHLKSNELLWAYRNRKKHLFPIP